MAQDCVLCGTPSDLTIQGIAFQFFCTRCGSYSVAVHLAQQDAIRGTDLGDPNKRAVIAGLIRRATDDHVPDRIPVLDATTVARLLEDNPAPTPLEQRDMFLEYLAKRTAQMGDWTALESRELWAARLSLKNKDGFNSLLDYMPGLFQIEGDGGSMNARFRLTLEGWKRAGELRASRPNGKRAFVAMWFNPDLNAAYSDGIEAALRMTGYEPIRIDRTPHNEFIDAKIVAEIRRSSLVIADATGVRPSVYYEAGFAMGLGVPVLWCCRDGAETFVIESPVVAAAGAVPPDAKRKTWLECCAFDTNHLPHIRWKTPQDLKDQLAAQIRYLGLSREPGYRVAHS